MKKELDKTTFWKLRDMSKKQLIIAITKMANKKGGIIKTGYGDFYPSSDLRNYKHFEFWNYMERLKHEPSEFMLLMDLKRYELCEIYAVLLGFEVLNKKGNPIFYKYYTMDETSKW